MSVCWRVGDVPASAAEYAETIVEPLRDRGRTERSQTTGGELDRERQTVEAKARCAQRQAALSSSSANPGAAAARPFDEEPDGLVAEQLARARSSARDQGCRATEPGTRPLRVRAAARGSWRGSSAPGRTASKVSARPAVAASRCSQLSTTSRSERDARNSTTASSRLCPGSARTSSAAATACGTSSVTVSVRQLDESHAARMTT